MRPIVEGCDPLRGAIPAREGPPEGRTHREHARARRRGDPLLARLVDHHHLPGTNLASELYGGAALVKGSTGQPKPHPLLAVEQSLRREVEDGLKRLRLSR